MTYGTDPTAWPGPPPEAAPRCYRHPDRETYIRCQRCDRPICPDCQIPAAVGFQCPDDVRAGSREVRPRNAFGGLLTGGGAPVTYTIIGICVVVGILQMTSYGAWIDRNFAMIGGPAIDPTDPTRELLGIADGEYYRLLTAAFLHGGWLHLLVNMFSLYILGPPLERMMGHVRFAVLYVISALGGAAASYMFNEPNVVALGASGAIFGLFGALFVVSRKFGYDLRPIIGILIVNLVIGFLYPNIDWRAHLGGLVTGAFVTLAFVYAPPKRRLLVQVGGCVVMLAVIAAVVVARTAQLV